jgi:hypothetical protein
MVRISRTVVPIVMLTHSPTTWCFPDFQHTVINFGAIDLHRLTFPIGSRLVVLRGCTRGLGMRGRWSSFFLSAFFSALDRVPWYNTDLNPTTWTITVSCPHLSRVNVNSDSLASSRFLLWGLTVIWTHCCFSFRSGVHIVCIRVQLLFIWSTS